MFTDMVGYTALGQRNESLSLALVDEQRKLIRPILTRHNGREIKTIGDGFLVQFPSGLDGVRCAYDIQRAIREFNVSLPEERRVHLRVGIHLGDVVEYEGDISGDAVNVASRIEPLAEDGGVCLTRQVYDQVQNKFELRLESLGPKQLKNVSTAMEVYRMVMPWEEARAVPSVQLDKKRIAVLPLANMSPDPSDEYFADGLTEELIDRLSQVRELEVIARTSIMSYKKKEKKASEIAKELSVGSLVEGSVRKQGNKIRVTVQLINGATEGHLWSSRYDRSLDDIFAVQSEISEKVTEALRVRLLPSEREAIEKRATKSTEAHTLYMKGRYYLNERTPASIISAAKYFERAHQVDPEFALAYVGAADCYLIQIDYGLLVPNQTLPKVTSLLDKALTLDEDLAEAHASLGLLRQYEWNWPEAEAEFKRAIKLNPNYATTYHWYSVVLIRAGRIEEALTMIKTALRLDPVSPIVKMNLGIRLAEAGRFEEGIEKIRKTLTLDPNFWLARVHLGAIYVGLARYDEGIAELQASIEPLRGNPWPKGWLGYALGLKGDTASAYRILRELEEASKNEFVPGVIFAAIYFAVGEKDKAFAIMEKEYEERSNALQFVSEYTFYRPIREDPRFSALLDKMYHTKG